MTNDAPGPKKFDHIQWGQIPNHEMTAGLKRYLETGQLPGDFLQALLSNNLVDVFARADTTNYPLIQEWCWWIHGEFPSTAWGSKETMLAWSKSFDAEHEHDVDWFGAPRLLDHDGLNTDVLAFKCRSRDCDMNAFYKINVALNDTMLEWM